MRPVIPIFFQQLGFTFCVRILNIIGYCQEAKNDGHMFRLTPLSLPSPVRQSIGAKIVIIIFWVLLGDALTSRVYLRPFDRKRSCRTNSNSIKKEEFSAGKTIGLVALVVGIIAVVVAIVFGVKSATEGNQSYFDKSDKQDIRERINNN